MVNISLWVTKIKKWKKHTDFFVNTKNLFIIMFNLFFFEILAIKKWSMVFFIWILANFSETACSSSVSYHQNNPFPEQLKDKNKATLLSGLCDQYISKCYKLVKFEVWNHLCVKAPFQTNKLWLLGIPKVPQIKLFETNLKWNI